MIHTLTPYPAYKDSGVPWLGEVPAHWEILRGKRVFKVIDIRSESGDEELLTVSSKDGVVPRSEKTVTMFKAESYVGHKLCWPGDLVINSLWAWMQGLGFSKYHGLVSSAYSVYRPKPEFTEYTDYFHYLLRSAAYKWELQTRSKGVWLSRLQLSDQAFLEMPIIAPTPEEQSAIVRYLDYMDRRIRRYIHAKQKLIKLLEEQKQAIIHRAVTRGLDPDVRLKDSGVEWLGDVPEHWEIRAFTRCAVERADYRGATPTKTENGIFLVTAKNIRKGWIDYEASKEFVSEATYPTIMRRGLPKRGDLLFTTEAPLGNAALVDKEEVALAQRVIRFRMNSHLLEPYFALYSVLSPYFQNQMFRRGTGSTALGIKASKLPQLQIVCPPIYEQRQILEHIENECSSIIKTLESATNEIALLREYRTRMISDVVTGKLDVREAAANLPEEMEISEDGMGESEEIEESGLEEDIEEIIGDD